MTLSRLGRIGFFALFVVSIAASAEASQFARCMVDGPYDNCPNALQWSCMRYGVYGEDFEDFKNAKVTGLSPFYAYQLANVKHKKKAQEILEDLILQGVCPGKEGNQPQTSMDPIYLKEMQKTDRRMSKRIKRLMKNF